MLNAYRFLVEPGLGLRHHPGNEKYLIDVVIL